MEKNIVPKIQQEQQLFSKEAVNLPTKERLVMLLKAKTYPLVRKRTFAEKQLKEMLDFYELCCFILAQFFPNEQAEDRYMYKN